MKPRPRFTVRRLVQWVALTAVAMAVGRYQYRLIREQQLFRAREQEGLALLQTLWTRRPPGISHAAWTEAVRAVQIAWVDVISSPECIDAADLDALLAEMRGPAALATPADAEGELYHVLDLLARSRTRASPRYLSQMRLTLRATVAGGGRPSPGLALYALSRLGSDGGEPALDAIVGGLKTNDWPTRVACCRALGQYALGAGNTAEAETAIDGLFHVLDDGDPLVCRIASEYLDEISRGTARASYFRIAKALLHDPDPGVRRRAERAVESIRSSDDWAVAALADVATMDAGTSARPAAWATLEKIDLTKWRGPGRTD